MSATAHAAAEEILQLVNRRDLRGSALAVDEIAAVITTALEEVARGPRDVTELHFKGFEAVQLLSTPPADGAALSPEDLRSLLGERLDQIRELSAKILTATRGETEQASDEASGGAPERS